MLNPASSLNSISQAWNDRQGPSPSVQKTDKVSAQWRGKDLALGIAKSRYIKAVFFAGLAVGGLFALFYFKFDGMPTTWMIVAASVGGYAMGLIIQLPCKGFQKMQFETSAASRLLKSENYNEIKLSEANKLYLGALPNKLKGDVTKPGMNIKAVLSINESWEKSPLGFSLPYQAEDWHKLGVTYLQIEAKDHKVLNSIQLHQAANFIDSQLKHGNVYVHCKAGHGRSAMAIAAYLIKYKKMTVDQACQIIKESRPSSTIMRKKEALKEFAKSRIK